MLIWANPISAFSSGASFARQPEVYKEKYSVRHSYLVIPIQIHTLKALDIAHQGECKVFNLVSLLNQFVQI